MENENKIRVLSNLKLAGIYLSQDDEKQINLFFKLYSIDKALLKINEMFNTNIAIGEYVIYSKKENGYWSNDFGWSEDINSATGYSEKDIENYPKINNEYSPCVHDDNTARFLKFKSPN